MSDTIILMHAPDLSGIANEAHQHELLRTLEDLRSNAGKNYAIYADPDFTPSSGLVILPFPSVGPSGSSKVCDGEVTISGNEIKVVVYRLK